MTMHTYHYKKHLSLQVCNHSEIRSEQYYRDSPLRIQENICRNFSKAIELFCFNKTEIQRYRIDFYHKTDSVAEKRCAKIMSQLENPGNEDVHAIIDVSTCTSATKLIAGSLNIEALKMVRKSVSQHVFPYYIQHIGL